MPPSGNMTPPGAQPVPGFISPGYQNRINAFSTPYQAYARVKKPVNIANDVTQAPPQQNPGWQPPAGASPGVQRQDSRPLPQGAPYSPVANPYGVPNQYAAPDTQGTPQPGTLPNTP